MGWDIKSCYNLTGLLPLVTICLLPIAPYHDTYQNVIFMPCSQQTRVKILYRHRTVSQDNFPFLKGPATHARYNNAVQLESDYGLIGANITPHCPQNKNLRKKEKEVYVLFQFPFLTPLCRYVTFDSQQEAFGRVMADYKHTVIILKRYRGCCGFCWMWLPPKTLLVSGCLNGGFWPVASSVAKDLQAPVPYDTINMPSRYVLTCHGSL